MAAIGCGKLIAIISLRFMVGFVWFGLAFQNNRRRREGRKSFTTNSTSLPSDKAEPLSACDAMINHRGTRQVDVKAERDTLAPGKLDSRKGA